MKQSEGHSGRDSVSVHCEYALSHSRSHSRSVCALTLTLTLAVTLTFTLTLTLTLTLTRSHSHSHSLSLRSAFGSGEAEGGESDRVPLMAPIHTDTELEENLESRHRDVIYLLILWCAIRLSR